MLKLLLIAATIMERTNSRRDLSSPEWLAIHITTTFALLSQKTAGATIDPAHRSIVFVVHIDSPKQPTMKNFRVPPQAGFRPGGTFIGRFIKNSFQNAP
jgi:hypothetical protein